MAEIDQQSGDCIPAYCAKKPEIFFGQQFQIIDVTGQFEYFVGNRRIVKQSIKDAGDFRSSIDFGNGLLSTWNIGERRAAGRMSYDFCHLRTDPVHTGLFLEEKIGSGILPPEAVMLLREVGQKDYGYICRRRFVFQQTTKVVAIQFGHENVGKNDVGRGFVDFCDGFLTVERCFDMIAATQQSIFKEGYLCRTVVDNKDCIFTHFETPGRMSILDVAPI